ncbi:fumarylacetoacetate hydrolase family protein [Labrys monachus]|uniref:Fumarylpyruvate hydrolase n=1 Tax=Labrys monachus TaxID=217067 RepID=A0ABU0FID4_9HYPH|nr:fumarylacetoacetate hydrolase family protein [Labrys monachus]MDQ0393884.1 fumarylpyruvate hydrolase [Labrys monachus]
MTEFVITPPAVPSVAVDGETARFPVRRIFCVGRNYAAHAREMGGDPDREPPFFFSKPGDAVVDSGSTIPYPPDTSDLHHEVELVVAVGKEGIDLSPEQALDIVFGYGVGIDLTRRDLQGKAKAAGRPWDWGKAFDRSAPCGPLRRASDIGHPASGTIRLSINGQVKQESDLSDMIWNVAETLSIISKSIALQPGDLCFTGTPEGVGAIRPGDEILAEIDGLPNLSLTIRR